MLRRGGAAGAINGDLQLAIVDDEFEQLVDRRLVFGGRQFDAPGEIGAFGVEGVERRHVPRVAFDAEFAHARQFAQQTDRLVALAIEVGRGDEFDGVASRLRLGPAEIVDLERERLEIEPVGFAAAAFAAVGAFLTFSDRAFSSAICASTRASSTGWSLRDALTRSASRSAERSIVRITDGEGAS